MVSKAFGSKKARLPHLVLPGSGLGGEVNDLRKDTEEGFVAIEASTPYVFRTTPVPTALVDADGILAAAATTTSAFSLVAAGMDGALAPSTGPAQIRCPKRVTITAAGGTPAHFTGGDFVVTGKDADGNAQTETLTCAAGAGVTTGTLPFSEVSSVTGPAQGGTGATIAIGVAAEPAAIASYVSSTTEQVYDTDAEFNRNRVGNRVMPVSRAMALVLSNHAHWTGGSLTVYGKDDNGDDISEVLTIPSSGNTTVNGDKLFKQVTRTVLTAQGGASGTATLGFRDTFFGLPKKKLLGAIAAVGIKELTQANNTVGAYSAATAGVFTEPASALPNGMITPNAAPDGLRDWVICYLTE